MPSPVVSPYGRIGLLHCSALQDLGRRVVVVAGLAGHALEAAALVRRALHQAEGAVGDGGEQRRVTRGVLVVLDRLQQVDALAEHLAGAVGDEAVGRGAEVLVQVAGGVHDVADVLERQVAVGDPGRDDRLGHHADEQDALTGQRPDEVEEPVEQEALEDVAGHVAGGRHPLEGGVGEQLAREHRVGELEAERVGHVGVDLERVAEAELPVLEAGLLGEVLVEELADRDRVGGLDGVGGGEVVVLAGVDDDAGAGVDLAAEALVDERADRVDVAEEDPVHRVVEHHVEPLEAGQGGDLGHAEAGGVVGEPDVAAQLLRRLVEGRPHQAEVLLGGVGAGEPLTGGAFGHEVEQRLPGRPDHRDDVGALAGCGLGLRDVLVDVAGGDDQVDPRLARRVADLLDHPLALAAVGVDPLDAGAHGLLGVSAGGGRVLAVGELEGDGTGAGLLGQGKQVVGVAAPERVPDGQGDAVLEADVGADHVEQPVDPRRAVGVGTGEAGQPQRGPLDGDGGVLLGEPDDRAPDLAGESTCAAYVCLVETQPAGGRHHNLRSKSPRTPASARSSSRAYAAWPGV